MHDRIEWLFHSSGFLFLRMPSSPPDRKLWEGLPSEATERKKILEIEIKKRWPGIQHSEIQFLSGSRLEIPALSKKSQLDQLWLIQTSSSESFTLQMQYQNPLQSERGVTILKDRSMPVTVTADGGQTLWALGFTVENVGSLEGEILMAYLRSIHYLDHESWPSHWDPRPS